MNENQDKQQIQTELESLRKTYDEFMTWFKEKHPDLYEKYGKNITVPFKSGGGVGITMDYKISAEEHKMLYEIAKTFYHSPSNE